MSCEHLVPLSLPLFLRLLLFLLLIHIPVRVHSSHCQQDYILWAVLLCVWWHQACSPLPANRCEKTNRQSNHTMIQTDWLTYSLSTLSQTWVSSSSTTQEEIPTLLVPFPRDNNMVAGHPQMTNYHSPPMRPPSIPTLSHWVVVAGELLQTSLDPALLVSEWEQWWEMSKKSLFMFSSPANCILHVWYHTHIWNTSANIYIFIMFFFIIFF